ncbi:MAG: Gfo/Idh/MocA family oxidoreductase, partial [Planctomycetia bacterium]
MAPQKLSRRTFVKVTGGTLAATTAFTAKSHAMIQGANERIRIGLIGAGSIGGSHVRAINAIKEKQNLEPVIVADCWKKRADERAKQMGASIASTSYKEVLDNKDVDYVIIATPEHQHETMTLDALDAGKAIYCEKPLTHTLEEARAVVKKQKETGLPLQVGVQGMSDDSYESAGKAIREGVLGRVV